MKKWIMLAGCLLATKALAGNLHDIVTKGSTDRSVTIYIMDSTDGTPETAVDYDTSGIDLWYRREGAAVTSLTEVALASLTTAHTDGGIEPVSHGEYRLDLPDAAFATGANYVDFGGTVTGMIVRGGRVRLVDFDLETGGSADWTSGEKENIRYALGVTGTKSATTGGVTDSILDDTGTSGVLLSTTAIEDAVDAVWDETATGHQATGKAGSQLWNDIDAILIDTDDIGVAGVGLTEAGGTGDQLTAIPSNTDWTSGEKENIRYALGITGTKSATSGGVTDSILDDTGTSGVIVATNSDKTGYSLTQTFPANFADLAITATTGRVTVGTNNDKTGYNLANDSITSAVLAASASDEIAYEVWEEILTGATHNTPTSAGRRLQNLEVSNIIHSGTTQAVTLSTATLDATAVTITGFYKNCKILLGVEPDFQVRMIAEYDGPTRVATFGRDLVVDPGETVAFTILPDELNKLASNGLDNVLDDFDTAVDTALSNIGLDHFLFAPVTGTDVTDGSIISVLMSKSSPADFDTYDNRRHSLQAIGDRTP